jgi:hypothetical protein
MFPRAPGRPSKLAAAPASPIPPDAQLQIAQEITDLARQAADPEGDGGDDSLSVSRPAVKCSKGRSKSAHW